ncbi:uncharacterized protein LOC123320283 isoform X2 [Coccinella septempunctata]|nr:uncharacterized protein LOC123320283 isoform X2 [Coccinella septempunctata]XP_044763501.1 uncharacterized protein LOC123320283 isoform X2 [Coccinella septempunctata]
MGSSKLMEKLCPDRQTKPVHSYVPKEIKIGVPHRPSKNDWDYWIPSPLPQRYPKLKQTKPKVNYQTGFYMGGFGYKIEQNLGFGRPVKVKTKCQRLDCDQNQDIGRSGLKISLTKIHKTKPNRQDTTKSHENHKVPVNNTKQLQLSDVDGMVEFQPINPATSTKTPSRLKPDKCRKKEDCSNNLSCIAGQCVGPDHKTCKDFKCRLLATKVIQSKAAPKR